MGTEVVVIGAGYAGLYAARRASRGKDVQVTLVDPQSAWVERTRLHQVAVGDGSVPRLPLADLFRGTHVEHVRARATRIDTAARRVELDNGRSLPADQVVYAVGSSADVDLAPGAAEHAHVLDDATSAARLHGALTDLTARTTRSGSAGHGGTVARSGDGRAVVVGGGLTGVEAAAETAEAFPSLHVTLLSADAVGQGLSPRGRAHVQTALERLGVTVQTAKALDVKPDGVQLTDGSWLPADLVIWTAGMRVPDLAASSGLATTPAGHLLVDRELRSTSHPWVHGAGDAAALADPGPIPVRPSAFTSVHTGVRAGSNIARASRGGAPKPLRFGYLVQAVSLGRTDGVAQFTDTQDHPRPWILSGRAAALFKDALERLLVVGSLRAERRLPIVFVTVPGHVPAEPSATSSPRATTIQAVR